MGKRVGGGLACPPNSLVREVPGVGIRRGGWGVGFWIAGFIETKRLELTFDPPPNGFRVWN